MGNKFKKIPSKSLPILEKRIKRLLSAGLDYCKNTNKDKNYWFSPTNPYYCEAFGLLQALECLGYGYFGPDSTYQNEHNLKFWFNSLKQEVKQIGESLGERETYAYYSEA
jgi:hypothetical protein